MLFLAKEAVGALHDLRVKDGNSVF
jgi:hypothetical protein